ncbi:MAG TPA: aminotransferase class III-fold pyridoxal phosphate-dependent enzyme [Bryobacteraceae bacterium]|nr:aminotransferase class III-fold pyridoxal phosphate-dependent enzyme [Bryobacteraceae bacterium]
MPLVRTRFRTIQTEIPCPGTEAILERLDRAESRSMHGQLPLVWNRAKDFSILDSAENRWIDFTSTIFVANIGHANPHLLDSLETALHQDLLHSYAYVNEIRARYYDKLIEFAPRHFGKAFLLSAGTEATEAALKLMRMEGQRTGKRRPGIVCIEGNWHGRTMGAQMMSSNVAQKQWIGFSDPNIHHIPFPYPWKLNGATGAEFFQEAMKALANSGIDLEKDVCGFMLETFQGWGAVFYPPDFVQAIEGRCRETRSLLCFDEMQAGFGRTGKRFGYEHYSVEPDLICCGKGMGSGLPLSGVIGRSEIMDLPDVGNMSSTHSANPLVCAAGLATIEEIERLDLVGESERKGKILHDLLNRLKDKYPNRISHILGKGMVAAVLFIKPDGTGVDTEFPSLVSERAMQKGLLVVHTGRESIKIGPPLTISDEALQEGVQVLDECITELAFRN